MTPQERKTALREIVLAGRKVGIPMKEMGRLLGLEYGYFRSLVAPNSAYFPMAETVIRAKEEINAEIEKIEKRIGVQEAKKYWQSASPNSLHNSIATIGGRKYALKEIEE